MGKQTKNQIRVSKYIRHQGFKEMERRRKQIERGIIPATERGR